MMEANPMYGIGMVSLLDTAKDDKGTDRFVRDIDLTYHYMSTGNHVLQRFHDVDETMIQDP